MELEKVKRKIINYAKDKKIDTQVAWDAFFFDEFINRLSKSEYKNCLIFKGGFLLQNILGIETRSTMDIDFKCTVNKITNDELITMISEIIGKVNDNEISFNIIGVEDIKAETKYGGKTIKLEGKYFNIKKTFGVDIGLSDIVTPRPKEFDYINTFTGKVCKVLAYPIETMIAEKYETLISKGTNNSRSKDLLDLYLLNKKGYDKEILNAALINTFFIRKTNFSN